ncbi:thioredoxin family protein [Thiovibrio frasassiensis]|uniref:Thioredoxin family protein n=1 Tax=Thiovibrio frasassiensis TaxID=2984131 RepID=A0A9X4MG55_9BACT|nr:thioredoxin family protein [Thiovibrio frasassiensis]MDG4476022.1 thioredoxin family protein [Thiovibrio frasassiensis]
MQNQDQPAPRTIRIGAANVGLIGLDQALNKALTEQMEEEAAMEFLFAAIARENYVPTAAEPIYREALRAEYRRRQGLQGTEPGTLTVRVLGSGCVTCNKLSAMLFESLQKFGLAADMESVHDLDEIWRFGVTKTPALIINNTVKCAGRMPSPAEVEEWVREESEKL